MLVGFIVLSDGDDEMVFNVAQSCSQEGVACILNPVCYPGFEMKEFTLSSQDGERDCEIIIVPVGEWNKAFLNNLCDIKYSGQIQRVFLFALTFIQLANA